MDSTAEDESSSHIFASFEQSLGVYESTPKSETDAACSFLNRNSKKRKLQYCDIRARKLDSLLELDPQAPQASSTLNENLAKEFNNINIEQDYFNVSGCDEPSPKFFKGNGCDRLVTPPSTPKSSYLKSIQKCSSNCSVLSPLKEQHDILYATLKPLEAKRKLLTPQKLKANCIQSSTPIRKAIPKSKEITIKHLLTIDVIMANIFKYLSNGDLFRVSQVCKAFRDAVIRNRKASARCSDYKGLYKTNKENYKITPPSSPEDHSLFPEGSVSPSRLNFVKFAELGKKLNPNQSLIKCPKCEKPSVVEKSIAQCQKVLSCGYIFCQKCDSYSYNPEDFFDKCRGLRLGCNATKARPFLENFTNCSLDLNISSIANSHSEHYQSSGYYSGYESSRTPQSAKRNLSKSFGFAQLNCSKDSRVLFDNNRMIGSPSLTKHFKREETLNKVAPIVQCENVKKKIEVVEPSSPPKVKVPSVCSKESKRNLRRLTR